MISKPLDLIAISVKQEPFQNNSQKSSLCTQQLRAAKSTLHYALSIVREGVKKLCGASPPVPLCNCFGKEGVLDCWVNPPSWGKNTQICIYYYTYMCMMSLLQQNTKQLTPICSVFVVLNTISCHSMQNSF